MEDEEEEEEETPQISSEITLRKPRSVSPPTEREVFQMGNAGGGGKLPPKNDGGFGAPARDPARQLDEHSRPKPAPTVVTSSLHPVATSQSQILNAPIRLP